MWKGELESSNRTREQRFREDYVWEECMEANRRKRELRAMRMWRRRIMGKVSKRASLTCMLCVNTASAS